jgi:hypothetical protein
VQRNKRKKNRVHIPTQYSTRLRDVTLVASVVESAVVHAQPRSVVAAVHRAQQLEPVVSAAQPVSTPTHSSIHVTS